MDILEVFSFENELKGVILASEGQRLFEGNEELKPVNLGSHVVAPWGTENNLPTELRLKIEKSEIISTNLRFNRDVAYGLGPMLVKIIRDSNGKVADYVPLEDGKEYEFFDRNDISMFVLEQLTDLVYFHNSFAEIMPAESGNSIYNIKHLEAEFSRWSVANNKGLIENHLYADQWSKPNADKIQRSQVIDEFNALQDAKSRIALNRKRMVYPVYMPSPGRPYYSRPEWYSVFESGWYDHSVSIPALKKAILKNNLGVKFIVYISPKYWEEVLRMKKIDPTDHKAVKEAKDAEKKSFQDFLSGVDNANKAIMTVKEMVPMGNTAIEHKWIEIVPVKNDMTGGEYIPDIESVANIISYAMGVHPSLIGAVPGKTGGSMSGTDKRELFMIKQALMKPLVDRVLRPLRLVHQLNGWDKDITIVVPEFLFTTLDQNKSGKQQSTTKTM